MANEIVIATFYHFADLPDYEAMREPLLAFCKMQSLKGTILLAQEGVNSTISGSREGIDALFAYLKADARFATLHHRESYADFQPFERMKVKLKKEVVTMGDQTLDIEQFRGTYVEPQDWDALISDPDTILVDTRNDYEVNMGTFEGAVNPHTYTFRDFPAWADDNLDAYKNKKVAMFCTGGIRCEKSTAYLKQQGFEHVYHLKGGILNYFMETGNKSGKWQGDCFVFDDRIAVTPSLEISSAAICPSCYQPFTSDQIKLGSCEYGVKCDKCLASHCHPERSASGVEGSPCD